jgi:hypothetical protein
LIASRSSHKGGATNELPELKTKLRNRDPKSFATESGEDRK